MNIGILKNSDIPIIVSSFEKSGWQIKPQSIFDKYLGEQNNDKCICFVSFVNNEFSGYVTLKFESDYQYFRKNKIPEISDLNVLPKFRNKRVGFSLIKKCEEYAAKKSDIVGIGVGLYPDYGPAQRLYVRCGYIPDGHGITYNFEYVVPGKQYPVDDDLILWFTKKLGN
jgi:GNAT superfamily N-acetyltransferase